MRGKDIIVVGLQPWDISIGSNCKNIAMEFARENRVLYVNRALDRITYWKNRKDAKAQARLHSIKGKTADIQQVADQLWTLNPRVLLESINWIKPAYLFDRLNYINNRRLIKSISKAAEKLRFKKPVIFIDNDFIRYQYSSSLFTNADSTIYYIRDYLLEHPYFKKHGSRLEAGIIEKANLVVTNSAYLKDYALNYNQKSFDVGQGCELDIFLNDNYNKPAILNEITRPIIGYTGALVAFRLNIDLLIQLAKRNEEWNFVLTGPEDETFKKSELHQLKNVLFTGNVETSQLPAYIANFDVCINPQEVNGITIGNYPRKVDEYLSMGKPVVATNTPAMQMFKEYVYLCDNIESYENAIKTALLENNDSVKQKRVEFALSHSWQNSVQKIYDAYEKVK